MEWRNHEGSSRRLWTPTFLRDHQQRDSQVQNAKIQQVKRDEIKMNENNKGGIKTKLKWKKTDLLHSLPNRNKERRTIRVKLPRKKPLL